MVLRSSLLCATLLLGGCHTLVPFTAGQGTPATDAPPAADATAERHPGELAHRDAPLGDGPRADGRDLRATERGREASPPDASPPDATTASPTSLPALEDTFVLSGRPGKTRADVAAAPENGDDNTALEQLRVGYCAYSYNRSMRSLLKFDLKSLCPAAKLVSARLVLAFFGTWGWPDLEVRLCPDSWSAASLTWLTQPACASTALLVVPAFAAPPLNVQSWDLTAVVKSERGGDGVLSLQLRGATEYLDTEVSDHESWAYGKQQGADLQPWLEVECAP